MTQLKACIFTCRETIPSGALTLDIALGGGFPKGRIIEARLLAYNCQCLVLRLHMTYRQQGTSLGY